MEPLRVSGSLVIPASELDVSFARSSGPGGQNVNKVETKVVLRFDVARSPTLGPEQRARLLKALASRLTQEGVLAVASSRHRERARNVEDARGRLAELLRGALARRKRRVATQPTRSSQRRRVNEKRRRGERKQERRRPPSD